MHGETSEIYLLLISLRAHFASLLFSLFLTDVHFVEMAMLVADWKKKKNTIWGTLLLFSKLMDRFWSAAIVHQALPCTNLYTIPFLTFIGPCIVIYSYNKSQRDALFLKFILVKISTCFGPIYCPSSGVSTLYTQQ